MPTLGTQTISSSYAQLIKTFSTGGLDGTLQVITDGDNTSSALSLSTSGVQSTGSFTVSSNSSLLGPVTFGSNITASTGTATIGTLFASGLATFGTSFTASTGTATIGTLSVGTATISTATIQLQLGNVTFGSNITASTGTATLGTIASATINNTGLATTGTLQVGASGPKLTVVSYGTAAFTSATVAAHNGADATTGTFALTGVALNDIVIGSLNSMGSAAGTTNIGLSIYPNAPNVVEYSIQNQGATAGTIPAGIFSVAALRFTA